MEAFHCSASMDDDQEGDWRELLQKWDEHDGLNITPTCTSILNVHSSLAMESLNPNFLSRNPSFCNSSSVSLHNQTLNSPQSPSIITPINQMNSTNQPVISLESAIIDQLNSSAALLNTIDADNLISTVRQQDDSGSNQKSSWFSTFLQSLQSQSLGSSSSSSYNNLLNISSDDHQMAQGLADAVAHTGDDHQARGLDTSEVPTQMYSHQPGLDDMMQLQMSHDFINYGAVGSLQEHLSNALSASDVMINRGHLMTSRSTVAGSSDQNMAAAVLTPASSVSSDGAPDDDSSSHEDMKDSAHALDPFDDLMMPFHNISHLPSEDIGISSQTKLQPESSAAPTPQDQDKKRGPKSARVTKKPKRERGAKLAIKIQSDVEVLDDGYKWRKYGQKAVKNSPYPRSYYKCTDKQCKVKKHVERQSHEPDYVVITYEGVHSHSRPDQQLQVFHSQTDPTLIQHHDSFEAFTPTPSSTLHLSPMEILGLRPSALFRPHSQPMSLPLQQSFPPDTHPALDAIDQGILETLFRGEPRRSST